MYQRPRSKRRLPKFQSPPENPSRYLPTNLHLNPSDCRRDEKYRNPKEPTPADLQAWREVILGQIEEITQWMEYGQDNKFLGKNGHSEDLMLWRNDLCHDLKRLEITAKYFENGYTKDDPEEVQEDSEGGVALGSFVTYSSD